MRDVVGVRNNVTSVFVDVLGQPAGLKSGDLQKVCLGAVAGEAFLRNAGLRRALPGWTRRAVLSKRPHLEHGMHVGPPFCISVEVGF